jgi:heat shock protein HtpX
MSSAKVFFLLAGLMALFGVVGQALGGQGGMLIAILIAGVMHFFKYFTSSKTVLHAYTARLLSPEEASGLYMTVDKLRQRAELPMPTVAIAPCAQPNAFATGRNPAYAVVCVTEGLLRLVDEDELEGVRAHELGHVKNRDMFLQTLSATMAGAISNLARFGLYSPTAPNERTSPIGPLLALLAPIAAMIIRFAISRQREFKADATGAAISGKPLALASALQKLHQLAQRIPMDVSPAVARLAQVNPLSAYKGLARPVSTHPSTKERIARLHAFCMSVPISLLWQRPAGFHVNSRRSAELTFNTDPNREKFPDYRRIGQQVRRHFTGAQLRRFAGTGQRQQQLVGQPAIHRAIVRQKCQQLLHRLVGDPFGPFTARAQGEETGLTVLEFGKQQQQRSARPGRQ